MIHSETSINLSVAGLAVAAQTGHGQVATLDLATGQVFHFETETGRHFDLRQIQNGIAAGAEEVDMGRGVGIESLGAVYGSDADDQALLFEKRQIPVDRGLRDIRVGLLQHLVNHLGGRVRVCVHQTLEDGVALTELLCTGFHEHLSFLYLRVILVYTQIIAHPFLFVNKNYSHLVKNF